MARDEKESARDVMTYKRWLDRVEGEMRVGGVAESTRRYKIKVTKHIKKVAGKKKKLKDEDPDLLINIDMLNIKYY